MNRLELLRKNTRDSVHARARVCIDETLTTKDMPLSIAQRKAHSIKLVLEQMPLYIGEGELIVGSRTLYGRSEETGDNKSCFHYVAMPPYINDNDVEYFGFNHQNVSKAHYTPDFSILLGLGIDGMIKKARSAMQTYTIQDQKEFANSVIIAYEGLKTLITRYSQYAKEQAALQGGQRGQELEEIAIICENISAKPPANIREAAQLFWFGYMGTIIENFQFVNYGRIDQVLSPYVKDESPEQLKEIMGCLLLKMYDQLDLVLVDKNLMGKYSAQHNITIGGVKRDGLDGCNSITRAILDALDVTRLPEPLVSVRIHKDAPAWLLEKSSALTVSGMNCMAYYNDELVIASLCGAGLAEEDARDYAFGLCQDILIQGRGDHYCSGGVNLTFVMLDTVKELADKTLTFDEFYEIYKANIIAEIDANLEAYNRWEYAILEYNKGNRDVYFDYIKQGKIIPDEPSWGLSAAQAARNESDVKDAELYIQTIMSPLPFTSSVYHGCIESGVDITRCGCELKDKGFMILGSVVAFNSLAALKKVVYEDKRYTLNEVYTAMKANYEGYEKMRQYLWNAPKWCNDDDYVDKFAVEIIKMATAEINKFKTPGGGVHLGGPHQPHPVFAGRNIPATPEGRLAGTPIPVTISPENGTLKKSAAEAMKSASKLDSSSLQWNSCLMLQYYSSTFGEADGASKFAELLKAYHSLGGIQHQPNVVNMSKLKDAQINPDEHKDLMIRMWGVSAHFVDLPRDVQDEFIARYDRS